MSDHSIREGDCARVHLRPGCPGGEKRHHPAEKGMRVDVSSVDSDGRDQPIRGLYKGGPWSTVPKPPRVTVRPSEATK